MGTKRSRLLDSKKGQRHSIKRRTICEAIRELYDVCAIKMHDNPDLLEEIVTRLEEIFCMGIKMNDKLIEYKMDTDLLFDINEKDLKEVARIRKERIRLMNILEVNKKILEEHE